MDYPANLLVKILQSTSKAYSDTSKVDDFYDAGENFPAQKYLRTRDLEKSGKPMGHAMRCARVQASVLEPIMSGVVDFLTGATVKSKLSILADSDGTGYYSELNDDVGATQRDLLVKGILHKQSFIAINFDDADDVEVSNLSDQKALGLLDASLSVIPASVVIDWQADDDGTLAYAKTYTVSDERSDPEAIWMPPDIQVHRFTFFTPEDVATYEASTPIKDGTATPLSPSATAKLVSSTTHSLGACPLVRFSPSSQIVDRLLPIADAHFQRTSSLTYALDTSAWSLPVISTDKPINEVMASEANALVLEKGGTVSSMGPNQEQNFTALASDADRLEMQLFKVIQAASLNSYQSGQNTSRLSGTARKHEASYLEILLASYADDLERAYRKAIELIVEARGDAVIITYSGADDFSIDSLTSQIDYVQKLLGLAVSASAKKFALTDLSAKVVSSAPSAIRQAVAQECQDIDLDAQAPNKDASASIVALVNSKVLTIDEAREALGYEPMHEDETEEDDVAPIPQADPAENADDEKDSPDDVANGETEAPQL